MATIELSVSGFPDDLPLLTEVVDEEMPPKVATPEPPAPGPRAFSEQEIQQLLHLLEARLETIFANKLRLRFEHLQRQAVEQTVNELKAELPELLRDALNFHLGLR